MMLYPAMSELLEQVPSRYKLVNVVAARARKIAAKADREHIMLEDKPVSIAIQEIAQAEEAAEALAQEAAPAQGEEEQALLPESDPDAED